MVTPEQVEQRVHSLRLPLENMFLITDNKAEKGIIVLWFPEFGAREWGIENDELWMACFAYLRDHGARKFASWDEFRKACAAEKWEGGKKWLGWDSSQAQH
jgi:hypothetical protein